MLVLVVGTGTCRRHWHLSLALALVVGTGTCRWHWHLSLALVLVVGVRRHLSLALAGGTGGRHVGSGPWALVVGSSAAERDSFFSWPWVGFDEEVTLN